MTGAEILGLLIVVAVTGLGGFTGWLAARLNELQDRVDHR